MTLNDRVLPFFEEHCIHSCVFLRIVAASTAALRSGTPTSSI
jgi:hypothetical protein